MRKYLYSQKGFAALIALIMVAMLTLLGLASLTTSDIELSIAGYELQEKRAFYASEAGMEIAVANLMSEYNKNGCFPTELTNKNPLVGSENMNGCKVTYTTSIDTLSDSLKSLTSGALSGLNALVKTFNIYSSADDSDDGGRVDMNQIFEVALVPIFQFGVFYTCFRINDIFFTSNPPVSHCQSKIYLVFNYCGIYGCPAIMPGYYSFNVYLTGPGIHFYLNKSDCCCIGMDNLS